MSDRGYGRIKIGGPVKEEMIDELCELICDAGVYLGYDESDFGPFEPSNKDDLTKAVEQLYKDPVLKRTDGGKKFFTYRREQCLVFSDTEARGGAFDAIETYCIENGIEFDRHSDSLYEFNAENKYFRNSEGEVSKISNNDGDDLVEEVHIFAALELLAEGKAKEAELFLTNKCHLLDDLKPFTIIIAGGGAELSPDFSDATEEEWEGSSFDMENVGTVTGRLSSSEPNLANIPVPATGLLPELSKRPFGTGLSTEDPGWSAGLAQAEVAALKSIMPSYESVTKLLARWDANEEIDGISMGGLGDSYELAIYKTAMCMLRQAVKMIESGKTMEDVVKGGSDALFDAASVANDPDFDGGITGAMFGVASNLVGMFFHNGYEEALEKAKTQGVDAERFIKIRRGSVRPK